jgi:hypothetical protein
MQLNQGFLKNSALHGTIHYACLWILIGIFSRIIPHPFNATATISLALWAPLFFKRWFGVIISLVSLSLSDLCLHALFHYPVFGSWSLFTYSATLALVILNRGKPKTMLWITVLGVLGFWGWTNFGTWLCTHDLYPKTAQGLLACFVAGLPFLKNSMIASLIYSLVLAHLYKKIKNFPPEHNNRLPHKMPFLEKIS